jgi:muramoyltetrapeptide carboxypeptidase LdcA involved in peptidoglycan recycling
MLPSRFTLLLDVLRHEPLRERGDCRSAKYLIGHSDVTSLQLAISGIWPQVVSVHGPNIATRQLLGDAIECELNRRSLHDTLFFDDSVLVEPVDFLVRGKATGALWGAACRWWLPLSEPILHHSLPAPSSS